MGIVCPCKHVRDSKSLLLFFAILLRVHKLAGLFCWLPLMNSYLVKRKNVMVVNEYIN